MKRSKPFEDNQYIQSDINQFPYSLVYKPSIRRVGDVGFFTIRRWREKLKRKQIDILKQLKRDRCDETASFAAAEITISLRQCIPIRHALVAPIPCGNGGVVDCMSKKIAKYVAIANGHALADLWEDRISFCGSHPKTNTHLEPLRWLKYPDRTVIVVDDVATSGAKMAQALQTLHDASIPAIGVSWISRLIKDECTQDDYFALSPWNTRPFRNVNWVTYLPPRQPYIVRK